MLNTALLGAGRIAGVHATAISTNSGSRLVAVSDINAEVASKLAAQPKPSWPTLRSTQS
jgi:myo-inositol 2-dehydrogenase / D-chiro-inositol 1-dehydrogenase